MKTTLLAFSRALFSLIFFHSAITQLLNWPDTIAHLQQTCYEWQIYFETNFYIDSIIQYCIAHASFVMGVATFLELVGGCLIFTSYQVRLGAMFLILLLIPKTVILHPFWLKVEDSLSIQIDSFLKNLSIIGALFYFFIEPRKKKIELNDKR